MAHDLTAPSPWVARFAPLVGAGAHVLDVACGTGRHTRLFAARGCEVEAVDRDPEAVAALQGLPGIRVRVADLEGAAWPYPDADFDAIVVANYLYRPLLRTLVESLSASGVLIYETFMLGNERFGRPANPDFLLRPGELLELAGGDLEILAFEQGYTEQPKPAMVQRLAAVKPGFRRVRAL